MVKILFRCVRLSFVSVMSKQSIRYQNQIENRDIKDGEVISLIETGGRGRGAKLWRGGGNIS